jgi:hypothetical protein
MPDRADKLANRQGSPAGESAMMPRTEPGLARSTTAKRPLSSGRMQISCTRPLHPQSDNSPRHFFQSRGGFDYASLADRPVSNVSSNARIAAPAVTASRGSRTDLASARLGAPGVCVALWCLYCRCLAKSDFAADASFFRTPLLSTYTIYKPPRTALVPLKPCKTEKPQV